MKTLNPQVVYSCRHNGDWLEIAHTVIDTGYQLLTNGVPTGTYPTRRCAADIATITKNAPPLSDWGVVINFQVGGIARGDRGVFRAPPSRFFQKDASHAPEGQPSITTRLAE